MKEHLKENKVDLAKAIGRVGPKLPIDPKTERFTGDQRRRRTRCSFREYRKGFEVPEKV